MHSMALWACTGVLQAVAEKPGVENRRYTLELKYVSIFFLSFICIYMIAAIMTRSKMLTEKQMGDIYTGVRQEARDK